MGIFQHLSCAAGRRPKRVSPTPDPEEDAQASRAAAEVLGLTETLLTALEPRGQSVWRPTFTAAAPPSPPPRPSAGDERGAPMSAAAAARIAELAPQVERLRMQIHFQALEEEEEDGELDEPAPLVSPLSQSQSSSPRTSWTSCSSSSSSSSSLCGSSSAGSPASPASPIAHPKPAAPSAGPAILNFLKSLGGGSRTPPEPSPSSASASPKPEPLSSLTMQSGRSFARCLRRRLASSPSIAALIDQVWAAVHAPRASGASEPDHLCYDRYTRSHLMIQRVLTHSAHEYNALAALAKAKRDWEVDRQGAPHVSRDRFAESLVKICASHVVADRIDAPASPAALEGVLQSHSLRALDFLRSLSEALTVHDPSLGCRRLRSSSEVTPESLVAISLSSAPLFSGPTAGPVLPSPHKPKAPLMTTALEKALRELYTTPPAQPPAQPQPRPEPRPRGRSASRVLPPLR
eukprot:tig00021525_g22120.t1